MRCMTTEEIESIPDSFPVKEFYLKNENVFEYGDKHFLGVGIFPPKNERDFSKTLWNDREMNFKNRNGEEIPYNRPLV